MPVSLKRTKPYRRKVLQRQKKWVPEVFLSAKPQTTVPVDNGTFPGRIPRSFSPRCTTGAFLVAEEFYGDSFQDKELLNKRSGLEADSKGPRGKQYCIEAGSTALPVKEDGLTQCGQGSNNHESNEIVVLNNSRRKCCCQGLKQNGTWGFLTARRRPEFKHCTLKSRSLFMMYKKLSMVTFRIRFAKSRSKFCRGKTYKSCKSKLSWVEKVTRDWQEDVHRGSFIGRSRILFPSWKSRSNSPWDLLSLSDMNTHMPGPLVESRTHPPDACLNQDALLQCRELRYKNLAARDQNGIADFCMPGLHGTPPCGAKLVHKEMGEAPPVDGCPDDIFISVTEKEISVSGQGDGESNQVMGAEEVVLEPSSADLGTNDDFANGPVSLELTRNEDSCSQMEVEGPISTDVFGAELLDHLYCKSPLDEPLKGSGGHKSGTPKGGKKNSQRASCVNDEQLAAWLCGICVYSLYTYYRFCCNNL
ncbi:hypothetical protein lerEdw1_001167 [Lerista edwardsae]|nr:hypothetical protein lerEdw1_001169 [Lerista edwardsae]KAJ6651034.1 hypothetical protein lerEdw1_001167 [Lerista edwardsae]